MSADGRRWPCPKCTRPDLGPEFSPMTCEVFMVAALSPEFRAKVRREYLCPRCGYVVLTEEAQTGARQAAGKAASS